jgi:hypothetical protein
VSFSPTAAIFWMELKRAVVCSSCCVIGVLGVIIWKIPGQHLPLVALPVSMMVQLFLFPLD